MSYIRPFGSGPGGVWEVPGTLGEQWAYDPHAVYEDAQTVIRLLVGVAAKGGNFLLNIGLDPTGVWAPAAVDTVTNMSLWMSFNSEAVHNTTPMFPFEYFHGPLEGDSGLGFTQYFTASLLKPSTYITLVDDRGANIQPSTPVVVPQLKPSLLSSLPVAVSKLTPSGAVPIAYTLDETGLAFNASEILVASPVIMGTYRHNYSDASPGMQAARSSRMEEWPQTWWKRHTRRGGAGASNASFAASSVGAEGGASAAAPPTVLARGTRKGALGSSSFARLGRRLRRARAAGAAIVDNAPCATRGCSVYTAAGYSLVRQEGVCYRSSLLPSPLEPAVQVNLFWNGQDDNLGSPTAPTDGQSWQTVDTECYAYANPGQGRLALEVWHSAALSDYWTLADPASRAEAQATGYTLYASLGYVDPAPAGGAPLPPSDATAASAAWAYVLRLDW
jgi:hypothetical protein